jgi:hypothetical protein
VVIRARVLWLAPVPQSPRGRRPGRFGADAVPEWLDVSRARHQQSGQCATAHDGHRDCLVLAAVSADEPAESVVPGAVRSWKPAIAPGGNRGLGAPAFGVAVALP